MKVNVIIIFNFFFLFASCQNKPGKFTQLQKHSNMDIIYEQRLTNLTLRFLREMDSTKCRWKTTITNKSGKELLIETDSLEKSFAWLHQEAVGESPVNLYNITTAIHNDDDLYIVYNRFGEVVLVKYTFTDGKSFSKKRKIIKGYMASGGFGSMINFGEFKTIEKDIYLYILVGQSFSGAYPHLYKIDHSLFTVHEIQFDDNIPPIKTVTVSEFSKGWMVQEERQIEEWNKMTPKERERNQYMEVPEEEKQKIARLKERLQEKFSYYKLSADEEKRRDEETDISNEGLDNYQIFKNDHSFNNAPTYIKEVLEVNNQKKITEGIKVLGYIQGKIMEGPIRSDLDDHTIYFFYQEESRSLGKIKIIRYDNHPMVCTWFIGDYEEKEL